MMTAAQFAALKERTPKDEPLFASLDEMCQALGFDDATKEQMRRDMDATAPRLHLVGSN